MSPPGEFLPLSPPYVVDVRRGLSMPGRGVEAQLGSGECKSIQTSPSFVFRPPGISLGHILGFILGLVRSAPLSTHSPKP